MHSLGRLESLDLCLKLESVNGSLVNADSLARLALSRNLSGADEIIRRGDAAISFALGKKAEGVLLGAALNHYARLHHERFLGFSAEPVTGDPSAASATAQPNTSPSPVLEAFTYACCDQVAPVRANT